MSKSKLKGQIIQKKSFGGGGFFTTSQYKLYLISFDFYQKIIIESKIKIYIIPK